MGIFRRKTLEEIELEKEKVLGKGFWKKVIDENKLKKPDRVAIMFLRNNGTAETYYLKSKNGMFEIDGKTYHERRDCVYRIGKERVPLAIIPEWSLIPIGTERF